MKIKKKFFAVFVTILAGILLNSTAYGNMNGTKDGADTIVAHLNCQLSRGSWYVPYDFPTIQQAVNAANPGDTVFVYTGIYYENVMIDKSITLIGESKETTIINGNGNGDVVYVSASQVSISGFTIKNDYSRIYCGVNIHFSTNNSIMGNIIRNSRDGISLSSSCDNIITHNIISFNSNHGIFLRSSNSNNTIISNIISDNSEGIVLSASNGNTINDNSFFNDGLIVMNSYHNVITNNSVNGKPLIYLEEESDIIIGNTDDVGQVVLVNCTNITIHNQHLSDTSAGIELWGTHHCLITSNIISNNSVGIYLRYSDSNTIKGNTISSTVSWDGISIWECSNNTIINNTISSSNWYGIYLIHSSSNYIIDNTLNANNLQGIYFQSSSSNTIADNIISNNNDGIFLHASSSNTIASNTISLNSMYGLWTSHGSSRNSITGNTISDNICGVELSFSSSDNCIYHNNLINNDQNAYDVCNNLWYNEVLREGNYWDDFSDNPGYPNVYEIPPDDLNIDRYPLVTPWGIPPGDLDHDGDVDLSDLAQLLAHYGTASGATYEMGDIDGDGDVDLSDLAALIANYET